MTKIASEFKMYIVYGQNYTILHIIAWSWYQSITWYLKIRLITYLRIKADYMFKRFRVMLKDLKIINRYAKTDYIFKMFYVLLKDLRIGINRYTTLLAGIYHCNMTSYWSWAMSSHCNKMPRTIYKLNYPYIPDDIYTDRWIKYT